MDFVVGEVWLDPGTTKNDDGRVFPMTVELRAVLDQQWQVTQALAKTGRRICPWVFHRRGEPIKSFIATWRTACRRAGCPGRIPHDFRRTAVRNLVRAGVPERVAMQLTGHKTRSVFERYNIVSSGDLRRAALLLDVTWPPETVPAPNDRIRAQRAGGRMPRKRYSTEQIVAKLRQAEVELGRGMRTPQVCKKLGISEQTYYRWRKEYGGLRLDQAKRLKALEQENLRLKKLVADQALDNAILKEVTSGNF